MKKVLSIALMLALVLSLSAVAFAAGSPSSDSPASAPEVYTAYVAPAAEAVDLAKIAETKVEAPDTVKVAALDEVPAELQKQAESEAGVIEAAGYTIDSGFVVTGDSVPVVITLPALPANAVVFVNGVAVPVIDGKITVTPPAVVIIAHR